MRGAGYMIRDGRRIGLFKSRQYFAAALAVVMLLSLVAAAIIGLVGWQANAF